MATVNGSDDERLLALMRHLVCEDESVAVLRALTPLLHRDHVAEAVHSVVYLLTFAPLAAEQQQQQHAKPRASEKRTGDLWFLVRVMEAEVAGTTVATGLFRETTALSAVLSAYAHLVCRRFLRATLEPPLRPVLCGVIPTSTPQELVAASAMMLQAIVVAIDSVPEPLCLLLHHVLRISYTKFPTERYMAIAGFFMLRLICPAIASPKQYHVISAESIAAAATGVSASPRSLDAAGLGIEALKSLAMISKLLLMASVGLRFETERDSQRNQVFNAFLDGASNTVLSILDALVTRGERASPDTGLDQSSSARKLTKSSDMLPPSGSSSLSSSSSSAAGSATSSSLKRCFMSVTIDSSSFITISITQETTQQQAIELILAKLCVGPPTRKRLAELREQYAKYDVVLTQDGKPDIIVQPGELVWRGPTKPVYSISFRNPAGSRSATASSSSASSTSTPPIVVSGDGARPTGTLRRSGDARHLTANIDLDGQTCVVSLSSLELKAYEVFDIWLKQLSRQSKDSIENLRSQYAKSALFVLSNDGASDRLLSPTVSMSSLEPVDGMLPRLAIRKASSKKVESSKKDIAAWKKVHSSRQASLSGSGSGLGAGGLGSSTDSSLGSSSGSSGLRDSCDASGMAGSLASPALSLSSSSSSSSSSSVSSKAGRKSRTLSSALSSSSVCEVSLADGSRVLVIVSPITTATVLFDLVLRQLCLEQYQSSNSEADMAKVRKQYAGHWLHHAAPSKLQHHTNSDVPSARSPGSAAAAPASLSTSHRRPSATDDSLLGLGPPRSTQASQSVRVRSPSFTPAATSIKRTPLSSSNDATSPPGGSSLSPTSDEPWLALDPLDLVWPYTSGGQSSAPSAAPATLGAPQISLRPLGKSAADGICHKLRVLLPSNVLTASSNCLSLKSDAQFLDQVKNVLACVSGYEVASDERLVDVAPRQHVDAAKKLYACLFEHQADVLAFLNAPSSHGNPAIARELSALLATIGTPGGDWSQLQPSTTMPSGTTSASASAFSSSSAVSSSASPPKSPHTSSKRAKAGIGSQSLTAAKKKK